MIKPFKDWELHKLIAVFATVVTLVATAYATLPWHATSVLVMCLFLGLFLLFYPWRFPKWPEASNSEADDDFYPIMKWGWLGCSALAVLVGLIWPTTNFVWVKSPEILAEWMQEAHLDFAQDQKMTRAGVWDAKLSQTNVPVPEILVGLPPLDQDRRPQTSEFRRCVPAIQALRTALGELSLYSREIRLYLLVLIGGALGLVVAERMHEATMKANARRQATATGKAGP